MAVHGWEWLFSDSLGRSLARSSSRAIDFVARLVVGWRPLAVVFALAFDLVCVRKTLQLL